jgi:DNA-binding FadR family transcriptional regulator
VRKALEEIETQGMVWRHVGKGTFVGRAPDFYEDRGRPFDISATPRDIFEARLGIEPLVAGNAALSAGPRDLDSLWRCVDQLEGASDWDTFEVWDRTFHRSVATATQNVVFVSILETINHLRQSELWTRASLPDLSSKVQRENTAMHRRIVDAIARQDMHRSATEMRTHLEKVRKIYLEVPILLEKKANKRPAMSTIDVGEAAP